MYSLHIDSFNLRGSVTEAAFGRARSTRGGGKYQLVACRLLAASRVGDPCGDWLKAEVGATCVWLRAAELCVCAMVVIVLTMMIMLAVMIATFAITMSSTTTKTMPIAHHCCSPHQLRLRFLSWGSDDDYFSCYCCCCCCRCGTTCSILVVISLTLIRASAEITIRAPFVDIIFISRFEFRFIPWGLGLEFRV